MRHQSFCPAIPSAGALTKSTAPVNDFLMASTLGWSWVADMKKINIRETEGRLLRIARAELAGPRHAESEGGGRELQICVPYTTPELARAALGAAASLAGSLEATAMLVAVHVVPIVLPLDEPNVSREHFEQKLKAVADACSLPVRVELVFAREKGTGFRAVLPAGSLVLIATEKRLWRTPEEKLARFLDREGHSVVLVRV